MKEMTKFVIYRKEDGRYINAEPPYEYTEDIDIAESYSSYGEILRLLLNHYSLNDILKYFEIHQIKITTSKEVVKKLGFKIVEND